MHMVALFIQFYPMDRVGCWNITRLNDPLKQYEIKKFLLQHYFSFFVVVETKVKENNFRKVVDNCGCGMQCISNYASDNREMGQNDQVIHIEVEHFALKTTYVLSMVYAANLPEDGVRLWESLCQLAVVNSKPWLICGDFNATLCLEERWVGGGHVQHDNSELSDLFADCELQDMKSTGSYYTWCNNRQGNQRQYCKLDRVLINSNWIQSNLIAEANFGTFEVSDHTPCVIAVKTDAPPVHRPFRFCDAWTQHSEFITIVREAWSLEVRGCHMYRCVQRLKNVKQKSFHRQQFSNIDARLTEIQQNMQQVHDEILINPEEDSLQCIEKELREEHKRLTQVQLCILKQKAKVQWMQQVDQNTHYYHAQLKAKKAQSHISSICNGQGRGL